MNILSLDNQHILVENIVGMKVELASFGASIYQIELKNIEGTYEAVTLVPSSLADFNTNTSYHGKTIGRYAGRIDKGNCFINDTKYNLDINWNNVNSLHGGSSGISSKEFSYEIIKEEDYSDIVFFLFEKEATLPGDVTYKITYRIYKNINKLTIYFDAVSTSDTLLNLTNHTYFNLSGNLKENILNHKLYLPCDKYTKLNDELITEAILEVDRVMDFRDNHYIKDYIFDTSLQNHVAKGYDHYFLKEDRDCDLIAVLTSIKNHLRLTITSSYPGVVFYSGNYPEKYNVNKENISNTKYDSLCLEPQYIPNGINMEVDTGLVKKDEKYHHYITYEFDAV